MPPAPPDQPRPRLAASCPPATKHNCRVRGYTEAEANNNLFRGRKAEKGMRVGGGWGDSSQLNAQGFHSHEGPASRACGFGWARARGHPRAVNNSCGQRSRRESGGCSLLHLARQSRPLLPETSGAAQGARCSGPSSGQAGAPRILFRPPGPP